MVVAAYKLEVDGRDVTDKWRAERRLLSIDVTDKLGASADACSLEIDDREPHVAWPRAGAKLHLWLGASTSELFDLGTYTLDVPEASGPPHRLRVTGHAASFVASGTLPMQTARSRLWENVTLADLAETIAADHGLTAKVATRLQASQVGTIEQIDESDLAFLERLAKRLGGRVRVRSGQLQVTPSGPLIRRATRISASDIESWHAPLGERLRAGKVVARWYAPKSGKTGEVSVGKGEPTITLADIFEASDAARSAAESLLKSRERDSAQLKLSLTSLRTDIGAGAPIAVSGVRSEVDGEWATVEVRHYSAADRARTSIVAERKVN